MRIGVNARLLVSQRMEGIPRYIYETTRCMAESHPEDTFYLFVDRQVSPFPALPSNVHRVIVPWHARHPLIWHVWLEYMLPLYFSYFKIDVFYSGDGYASLRTRVPTVMAIHDLAYLTYPEHITASSLRHYQKFIPRYVRAVQHVITVSQYVKRDITRRMHVQPSKISVAGNAIHIPHGPAENQLPVRLHKLVQSAPYFLYVGAIHPRKNILNLMKAFRMFNRKRSIPAKLVLAGRLAWKAGEIEAAMQLDPDIVYAGSVSEEEKYSLIRNAVAVAYVSLFEGFGIPILESMACGTPVITSTVTSMPEVAGGAALLADPSSPAEIAQMMSSIADHPLLRQKMSELGQSRLQAFSWYTSAETIYQALQKSYRAQNLQQST